MVTTVDFRAQRPAYVALQKAFKEWLESENVRADVASNKAGNELDSIRDEVIYQYQRNGLNPDFDFDACSLDEETASLFKRYLALSVVQDVELQRQWLVSNALRHGEIAPAYREFISCYDEDLLTLHVAMVEEMCACQGADEVATPEAATPATLESLVQMFDETFVRLVDEARDALAAVKHKLKVLDFQEGERAQLRKEKARLKTLLSLHGLDDFYWWARQVKDAFATSNKELPLFEWVLSSWKEKGIAGEEITARILFDAYFESRDILSILL